MSEWLKEPVSKTGIPLRVSWVRIPPCPFPLLIEARLVPGFHRARFRSDRPEPQCTAIGVGGDTDTMAAIAGAISGARLGPDALPQDLVDRLTDRGEWGRDRLAELGRRAARLVED